MLLMCISVSVTETTLSKTVTNIDICIQHWTVDSGSEDVQIFKYVVLGVDIVSSFSSY